MRKAFDKYDVEKDGVISLEEFKAALAEFNYTDEELKDMFSHMVRNKRNSHYFLNFLLHYFIRAISYFVCCYLAFTHFAIKIFSILHFNFHSLHHLPCKGHLQQWCCTLHRIHSCNT